MSLNLIVETQLSRFNPRQTTKEFGKVGMEAQQVVGLLSVMVAGESVRSTMTESQ
jgi:hypothetical protein